MILDQTYIIAAPVLIQRSQAANDPNRSLWLIKTTKISRVYAPFLSVSLTTLNTMCGIWLVVLSGSAAKHAFFKWPMEPVTNDPASMVQNNPHEAETRGYCIFVPCYLFSFMFKLEYYT